MTDPKPTPDSPEERARKACQRTIRLPLTHIAGAACIRCEAIAREIRAAVETERTAAGILAVEQGALLMAERARARRLVEAVRHLRATTAYGVFYKNIRGYIGHGEHAQASIEATREIDAALAEYEKEGR